MDEAEKFTVLIIYSSYFCAVKVNKVEVFRASRHGHRKCRDAAETAKNIIEALGFRCEVQVSDECPRKKTDNYVYMDDI